MFASADPLAFLDFASLSLMLEIRIAATPPEFQPIPELSTLSDLVSVLIFNNQSSFGFAVLFLLTPSSVLFAFPSNL